MTEIKTYKGKTVDNPQQQKSPFFTDKDGKEWIRNPDGTKIPVERKSSLITKKDMPDLSDEEIDKMNNVLKINRVVLSTIDSNENLMKDLKTHYDVVRVTLNILSQFGVLKDATKALEELKKND